MALVLYDTNILIDALKGYTPASDELAHWDDPAISVITYMEVYGAANVTEVPALDAFMTNFGFEIIHTDDDIMKEAASVRALSLRHGPKVALPDAIIMATATVKNLTVITRNKKDFRGKNVRIPYELETTTTVSIINVNPPGETPTSSKSGRPILRRLR